MEHTAGPGGTDTFPPIGPRREPPDLPGYRLIARERIPIVRVTWLGVLTVPFWLAVFNLLSASLGGRFINRFTFTIQSVVIGILIVLIVVPVVHEVVHGVVARLAGARPKFGVGAGFAYTTFREPVGLVAYWVIGLAPLVVLSLFGLAVMVLSPSVAGLTLVFLVANASGAMGDVWVAWHLRALPREVRIFDLADGFAAFVPERS